MSKNYTYALSVDLGIASIGTALIRLNQEGQPLGILDAGVRIFDTPIGAAERRTKRQMRKTLRRRRARVRGLQRFLQNNGLLPQDHAALKEIMARSPYRLRAHGARYPFATLYELGRCLVHIAKFRGAGFLSQQEDIATDNDETTKKKTPKTQELYTKIAVDIRNDKITLGEFFMRRLRDATTKGCIRRRDRFIKDALVDYAVPRFLVKDDFHKIWDRQQPRFAETLTQELKDKIFEIIFSDRPHAPYATGVCSVDPESKEPRLPKIHRLAEEKRIYEQVNNLRYQTASMEYPLERTMRDGLVAKAMNGETLNQTLIKKYIKDTTGEVVTKVNMPDDVKGIKPFSHVQAFADVEAWKTFSQAEQDDLIMFIAEPRLDPNDPHSRLMQEEPFLKECAKRLQLTGDDAEQRVSACLHALPKDRTALGITATTKILEKLKEGITATKEHGEQWLPLSSRKAQDLCGYEAEEEQRRRLANTYDILPYYGQILRHDVAPVHPWHSKQAAKDEATYGRFPNPVVHVVLNQLRKVINEIIELYGKPQRIHVELAREFGMSAVKREKLIAEQKKRAKENDDIDNELKKAHLAPTRKNRIKYRLWREQGYKDIYTLQEIKLTDFVQCEIDHIIPQAVGGSDTYANLALTKGSINLAKGNTFAYDFLQQTAPDRWQHILKEISATSYPKSKRWRFLPNAEQEFTSQGDEEQTDHRLTDTSYMGKMAARYLSVLCADGNVVPVRGALTAKLRHLWGLDGLEYELMGMKVSKELYDPETGELVIDEQGRAKRNPEWQAKPRIDHRHHALDAVVLACTTRGMVQRLTGAERKGERIENVPPPFGGHTAVFREAVLKALQQIKVSPKAEHGLGGQLHDATKYRVICAVPNEQEKFVTVYQRKLDTLKSEQDIQKLVFKTSTLPQDEPLIQEALAHGKFQKACIEQHYDAALHWLNQRNAQLEAEGNKPVRITEELRIKKAIQLAQKSDKRVKHTYKTAQIKTLVGVSLEKQCGYEPQNNFRVDFFVKENGKIGWECIKRFDANQKDFVPQWQQDGSKLLWSVWKGDVLELTIDEAMKASLKMPAPVGKVLCVVQKFSNGILQINLLNDARSLDNKQSSPRWASGNAGLITYIKTQARKVELTPFGKVHRKHIKLWEAVPQHGKKTTQKK